MNYAVISFLKDRLDKNMRLFEYGSGYSTLFYSSLVKSVVSVEYDKEWYETISGKAGDNVRLIYQPLGSGDDYCSTIKREAGEFDVVIIDGRERVKCAINSWSALSESGVIVFDDSERLRYAEGLAMLRENGFRSIFFEGLKPKGIAMGRTSIFYRKNNCLEI